MTGEYVEVANRGVSYILIFLFHTLFNCVHLKLWEEQA